MILYTTLATIAAVALALALNASRAQVRGLSRELRKKSNLITDYEIKLMFSCSELLGALDKAKTWEGRGEELQRRCLVAENDLAAALQKLFALEGREAVRRENARLRKAKERAKKKEAGTMTNNKQQTPAVVKQSTGMAINTENVSPELINFLTQKYDNEDDYFSVIGMDNGTEEHKSLMESMSKMGMECRKGDNNAK